MLSTEQLDHLEKEGYLVVENALNPESDLDPILHELSEVADGLAKELVARGELSSLYEDHPFGKRMTQIIAETGQSHSQHFDFSLPKGQVGATAPMYLGQALFQLVTNRSLLDCVQSVIGQGVWSILVAHSFAGVLASRLTQTFSLRQRYLLESGPTYQAEASGVSGSQESSWNERSSRRNPLASG
jgi:hypothetical protein